MHDLFIIGTRGWNSNLVKRQFNTEVAKKILRVKPLPFPRNDILVWKYRNFWEFSVKAAY